MIKLVIKNKLIAVTKICRDTSEVREIIQSFRRSGFSIVAGSINTAVLISPKGETLTIKMEEFKNDYRTSKGINSRANNISVEEILGIFS